MPGAASIATSAGMRGKASARVPPALPFVVVGLVLFAVSGGVLWYLGLNYDGLSGSAAAKIHPATYLSIGLVAWAMVRRGDPVGYGVRAVRARPASLLLLAVAIALSVHITLRGGSGLAGAVDTFAGPALLVVAMMDLDAEGLRRIEVAIHTVMAANAALGLAEFLTGTLVFPYRFDGAVFETDTRSAALQGHPLANATITAVYLLAVVRGGCAALPRILRAPMVVLQLVALVTFGGRSAIVVALVLGAGYGVVAVHRVVRTGRVPLLGAAVGLVLLAVAPLAAAGLAVGGFFDKLALRFVSDGGSANARIEMFELFDRIAWRDLMFGPDTALVDSLRRINGLEWGIENPIIRMVLYQGIFLTSLVTLAVVLFIAEVIRWSRIGTLLPTLAFAILINTSESLAGKTPLLTKYAVLMLVLYRPLPRIGPRARTALSPEPRGRAP